MGVRVVVSRWWRRRQGGGRKGKGDGRRWAEGRCETCDIYANICDATYTMFAMCTCTHVKISLYMFFDKTLCVFKSGLRVKVLIYLHGRPST